MNYSTFPLAKDEKVGWPWNSKNIDLLDSITNDLSYPKITIVTPSFNQGEFIEETIRSVILQGYPNLEYMIMDGGSNDETVEIIKKYEPWLSYWESVKDKGQSHAINKGFNRATGEILAWLNSDDIYTENTLKYIAQKFAENPDILLICGDCYLGNREAKITGIKKPPEFTLEHFWTGGNVPGQPAVFFRKQVIENVGNIDESLHYLLDWELWFRISLNLPKNLIMNVDKPLALARIWDEAKTSIAGIKAINERKNTLDKHKKDLNTKSWYNKGYANLYKRYTLLHWHNKNYPLALKNILQYLYFSWKF